MESSVRAAFETGASYCTVHAQAGPEALSKMAELEEELCRTRPFRILAVTILTSFRQETLSPVTQAIPIAQQTLELAKNAVELRTSGASCPRLIW